MKPQYLRNNWNAAAMGAMLLLFNGWLLLTNQSLRHERDQAIADKERFVLAWQGEIVPPRAVEKEESK